MNNTPRSNRIHIAVFGKRNAGKSSLVNALTEQEVSVVSPVGGTTTDPVNKAMELIPIGPVVFIDTAGIDDNGKLGRLRVEKTKKILRQADFAIYIQDINDLDDVMRQEVTKRFKQMNIPNITVVNKIDNVKSEKLDKIKKEYNDCLFISCKNKTNVKLVKEKLIKRLKDNKKDIPIVGDLVPYNGKVILVVLIDSEAPKGRIIIPQVQLIRDCLDHGIKSYVVRDTELKSALFDIKNINLVVTDSQAFKRVNKIVPDNIPLTSFSILLSRVKGDIKEFLNGISAINELTDSSNILIAESCTHNRTHEDIGRVKIPKSLNKLTCKQLNYHFKTGRDFPDDLSPYDLVIHCASCMFNRKTMMSRIRLCKKHNLPIINYGMFLAHFNGILKRAIEVFENEDELKEVL